MRKRKLERNQDAKSAISLAEDVPRELSKCWKSLFATDLLYKLLSFVLLVPLGGVLFRGRLFVGGNDVLSDLDIALFFARPWGWFCAIAMGAVWLGMIALEQVSLLAILAAHSPGLRLIALGSLRFAAVHALPVLQVTSRLIAWSRLVMAPFLIIALAVYVWLLREFDIHYYLQERPVEFQIAVGLGGVLALGLAGI